MQHSKVFSLLLFISITVNAQTTFFSELLSTYVNENGKVNYRGIHKNRADFDAYLSSLDSVAPDNTWSSNKAKAFWINVYNAYTIKLIVESYPLTKITDIKRNGKNAWEIPYAKVGGKVYSLDYIEHKILRRWYTDPRVHVGLNAGSTSGPRFANFIFTEKNVNTKLEKLMEGFINDTTKNKITPSKIEISEMFDWYKEDFTHNITIVDYINKYSKIKANKDAEIIYLKYDWKLNDKR